MFYTIPKMLLEAQKESINALRAQAFYLKNKEAADELIEAMENCEDCERCGVCPDHLETAYEIWSGD